MTQVVEHLPNKDEALRPNPSIPKINKINKGNFFLLRHILKKIQKCKIMFSH
jgi:hypothetical protein